VARPFMKTITRPDSTTVDVPMWGFAVDADSDLSTIGTEVPTVPGPMLTVSGVAPTLNVHVRNELPDPISIVIPGQPMILAPEKFADGDGRMRASSFTASTDTGDIGTYTFANMKPGTHMYYSGTHPQVEVQMGLYGGVKVAPSPGIAYPGVPYTSELVVFYSEVDVDLHAAVDGGTYGVPGVGPTSTYDYNPDYFLVNGESFVPGQGPLVGGGMNQTILLRFLNAGLTTHLPLLLGDDMRLIAEDGFLYPFAKTSYEVKLPALKTIDALWQPTSSASYPLLDRAHSLTAGGLPFGGLLAAVSVADRPCGDVNDDGAVNIVDALVVAQYSVGLRTCPDVARYDLCDVAPTGAPDGSCNIGDALRMAQCSVGLVPCNLTCEAIVCIP